MTSMQGYDSLVGRGEASGSGGPVAHGERGEFLERSSYDRPARAVRAAGACMVTVPPHRVPSHRVSCSAPFGRAPESHRTRRADPARSRRLRMCGYFDRAALKADSTGRAVAPDAAQGLETAPGSSHRTEDPRPTEDPGHAEDDGESDQYDRTGTRVAHALMAGPAAGAGRPPLLSVPRGRFLPCAGSRPPRASMIPPYWRQSCPGPVPRPDSGSPCTDSHQSPHRTGRMP